MHPTFILSLAAERLDRFRQEADARRLAREVSRLQRPHRAIRRRGSSPRLTSEACPP